MTLKYTIESKALPSATHVVGFEGREALSELYCFQIDLLIKSPAKASFDPEKALGARATLKLTPDGLVPKPTVYHGILSSVELVNEYAAEAVYRVQLVPALFNLGLSEHSRMFTDMLIKDILDKVLKDAGMGSSDYQISLSATYPKYTHVCQHHESDLRFLMRRMERDGIYFFFEHGDSQEKLIITDDKQTHDDYVVEWPLIYRVVLPSLPGVPDHGMLRAFYSSQRALPAKVDLVDYDPSKPQLDVSGGDTASPDGLGDLHIHGGNFMTPSDGKRLASVRAQEQSATTGVFEGAGDLVEMRPGYIITVEGHPRQDANGKFVIRSAEHSGVWNGTPAHVRPMVRPGWEKDLDVYVCRFTAHPKTMQYRPPRRIAWPRIWSVINAVIDGPADSQYAQIDSEGRYKVKLYLDESSLQKGNASTWIRMIQPHAGDPEGFHFPLRNGSEVLVTFLEGDPDRPLIAGFVPDALHPSPVTSSNHTQNIIHTGGGTQIEMEDLKGKQYVYVYTPIKDTILHLGEPRPFPGFHYVNSTKGNELLEFGGNFDVEVGGHKQEHVHGPVLENYDGTQDTTVTGPQDSTVDGGVIERYNTSQKTVISGPLTTTVTGLVDKKFKSEDKRVPGLVDEDFKADQKTKVGPVVSKFTELDETVHGLVKHQYGPVMAKWASLDISIPKGGKITAGSWNILNQQHAESITVWQWLGAAVEAKGTKEDFKGANKASFFGVAITGSGFDMGMIWVQLAAGASKSSAWGASIAISGFKKDFYPGNKSKGGAKLLIAASIKMLVAAGG